MGKRFCETYVGVILSHSEAMSRWANKLDVDEVIELDGAIKISGFEEGLELRVVFEKEHGLDGVIVGRPVSESPSYSVNFSALEQMRKYVGSRLVALDIIKEVGVHHIGYHG